MEFRVKTNAILCNNEISPLPTTNQPFASPVDYTLTFLTEEVVQVRENLPKLWCDCHLESQNRTEVFERRKVW